MDPLDARPVDEHLREHEVAPVVVQPERRGARLRVHHRKDDAEPEVKHACKTRAHVTDGVSRVVFAHTRRAVSVSVLGR